MQPKVIDVLVIGGGASGVFFAANVAQLQPHTKIVLLEKTRQLLSKVKVSGGGRCNVTHNLTKGYELLPYYPRGGKSLRPLFDQFHCAHTRTWFQSRGVPLKAESDGRVFPVSNRSQSVIDCLTNAMAQGGVEVRTGEEVRDVQVHDAYVAVTTPLATYYSKIVYMALGGINKPTNLPWLSHLNFELVAPVPSLFTFNTPHYGMKDLSGLSVPEAAVKIAGTQWKSEGPLLITHWGFSGPAILKLSSWAARDLAEKEYRFSLLVQWHQSWTEHSLRALILREAEQSSDKKVVNGKVAGVDLPLRLWQRLAQMADIPADRQWSTLSKKHINKLIHQLLHAEFEVTGKTTFKEEFVTAGGVSLAEIHLTTMASRRIPGLYFGGEMLDVDALTGGFNFQFAWSSAYVAAQNAALQLQKRQQNVQN